MSLVRVSLVLTGLALLSRVLGLARDLAVTWAFGAMLDTDAFYIASSVSTAAYVVIAVSLNSAAIPVLAGLPDEGRGEAGLRTVSGLLNLVVVALALLAGVGLIGAEGIARLLAAGGSEALVERTAGFLRVLMPTVVLLGAAGVLSGLLNHNRVFVPVAAAPAAMNLAVVVAVALLAGTLGIEAAVLGTLLGAAAFALMQLPGLYGVSYRHRWRIPLTDPALRGFARSALPVLGVALLGYAYAFVDIAVGARIGEGTVTAINVAAKLIQLPQGVIAMGLTTASFPLISRMVQARQVDEAAAFLRRLSITILLVSIPAAALMAVQADLIVAVVFGRGTFADEAVAETARILAVTALSLPALSLAVLLLRVFYALGHMAALTGSVLAAFAVKVALAFALRDALGIDAVSVSTVAATTLGTVLMTLHLDRALGRPFGRPFGAAAARMAGAAAALAGALLLLRRAWPEAGSALAEVGELAAVSGLGLAACAILGLTLFRPEIRALRALRGGPRA